MYLKTLILIIFFQGFQCLMFSQDLLNPLPVGTWREGSCNSVVQVGKTLFYTNGCFLEMVELDEENFPQRISHFESRGRIYDLAVSGTYVYLAIEKKGMSIISMEDFEHPVETGFCEYQQYYPQLIKYGHILYSLAGSGQHAKVMDVSDPHAPRIIHTITIPSVANAVLHSHYIYAACKQEGFIIFDISDPSALKEVFKMKGGYYSDVDVNQNRACALASDTLKILDVTNVELPALVSQFKINGFASEARIRGNYVYAANYNLQSIDITNPGSPVFVDQKDIFSTFRGMSVSGNQICVATENGLLLFKSGTTGLLDPVNEFPTPGLSNSLAFRDPYMYVANQNNGISILDVHEFENPVPVQFVPVENEIFSLAVKNNYLFTSNRGLSVFDISNPIEPILLSHLDMNQTSYKMYILEDILYLAAGTTGLALIDISNPVQPVLMSVLNTPGIAYDMDIHPDEKKLYLADYNGGLRIVDISDPVSPLELGSITKNSFKPIATVKVKHPFVWVGGPNFGIRIFDMSNLAEPVLVKDLNTARGYDIHILDQLALVSAGYNGMFLYNISEFHNPKTIQQYMSPGEVKTTYYADKHIFFAEFTCGLGIFELDPCMLLKVKSFQKNNRCFETCDGSIEITEVESGHPPFDFNWSNGLIGPEISDLCKGNYSVTITDAENCMTAQSFIITEPAELVFEQIQKTDVTPTSGGTITVIVSGGTPPYKFHWKGPWGYESTNQNIDQLSPGSYRLEVIDANDCVLISDPIDILQTGTGELSDNNSRFVIYPNPAKDHFTLCFESQETENICFESFEIYSVTGKLVRAYSQFYGNVVDIRDLVNGSYIVRVMDEKSHHFQRLIISR